MSPSHTILPLVLALAALAAGVGASPAAARDDDGREVRVRGTCTAGATARLKLKADDDRIEVELEVERGRAGAVWDVTLVHERRVAWRGRVRAQAPGGSLEVKRRLADLPGYDSVTARALAPGGRLCRATATLPGP